MQSRLFFFALIALLLFLIHAPLLRVPFYWDELGQFVPASLDLFRTGAWIPYTTVPNVHPPGLMAYLAAFWSIAGFSVPATRIAMLLLASAGGLAVFLLAIELSRNAAGMPAFTAVALLTISPLFVAQSMLAQLDMPAMVFTCLALLVFLQNKIAVSAAACCVLVMMKETGIVAPMVLGAYLFFEGRRREALWFALPLIPLTVWLLVIRQATGHWFGSAQFAEYNLLYPLNPVRLVLAMFRRLYYLFIGTFHWAGTAAVIYCWRRAPVFRERSWRIAALFVAAHVALVTMLGGAVLERYLLPALPLIYIAFAIAFAECSPKLRVVCPAALAAALLVANFVNPPYPFPFENNLAFTSFVALQEQAAEFLQANYPHVKIATTFPLAGALRRPDFGYVSQQMDVRELKNFGAANIAALRNEDLKLLVLYPTAWDPWHVLQNRHWAAFLQRFYDYEPQVSSADVGTILQMHPIARWTRNGQWIEIFSR